MIYIPKTTFLPFPAIGFMRSPIFVSLSLFPTHHPNRSLSRRTPSNPVELYNLVESIATSCHGSSRNRNGRLEESDTKVQTFIIGGHVHIISPRDREGTRGSPARLLSQSMCCRPW